MKITIEKFGPIDKFEYDLEKDLIITYGNNNIGKSYAMQIVYLLLKAFIDNQFIIQERSYRVYLYPHNIDISVPEDNAENIVRHFMDSGEQILDITPDIVTEVCLLVRLAIMPVFMNSCASTFGNLEKTLEKNPVITLQFREYRFTMGLNTGIITGSIDRKPVRLIKTDSASRKAGNPSAYVDIFATDSTEKTAELVFAEITKTFMLFMHLVSGTFRDVYFLPASRSGIYAGMNAFGSIVAELSQKRAYITKKIEFPGISEPISDYFIALSSIKTAQNKGLEKIYGTIEGNILKGRVTFDKAKSSLMYEPENIDASYEMTEVSSMVSEIAPVVAFLKYIIKPKSVLFIEEPEAHLHPDNQIALIEIFTRLINLDVKLVMSSHSNYVFNKINNLILAKKLDYHLYDPIVLEDKAAGSVSKHIAADELGADDENFVDVSERLYNEREEIIEKLNAED